MYDLEVVDLYSTENTEDSLTKRDNGGANVDELE